MSCNVQRVHIKALVNGSSSTHPSKAVQPNGRTDQYLERELILCPFWRLLTACENRSTSTPGKEWNNTIILTNECQDTARAKTWTQLCLGVATGKRTEYRHAWKARGLRLRKQILTTPGIVPSRSLPCILCWFLRMLLYGTFNQFLHQGSWCRVWEEQVLQGVWTVSSRQPTHCNPSCFPSHSTYSVLVLNNWSEANSK